MTILIPLPPTVVCCHYLLSKTWRRCLQAPSESKQYIPALSNSGSSVLGKEGVCLFLKPTSSTIKLKENWINSEKTNIYIYISPSSGLKELTSPLNDSLCWGCLCMGCSNGGYKSCNRPCLLNLATQAWGQGYKLQDRLKNPLFSMRWWEGVWNPFLVEWRSGAEGAGSIRLIWWDMEGPDSCQETFSLTVQSSF